ncbi:MAG TPA: glycosyl hydrolase family 65 protein, partial [Gammaproteobacteria bacterium]|nr:glycosyl hydrolase family 65 protein [Gammaproteobacteria bacterium]
LLAPHRQAWRHLWNECDVTVQTDEADSQLKVRLQAFHLLQTVSPHTIERDIGAPARGWHGEAYRGHIFWDELFIFPFINLRLPVLTRALLRYRYRRLPAARALARQEGHAGAMYPWQSGSEGREESQTLHLNPHSGRWIPDHTHRQRHINAAIAYNVWQYYQVTEDHEFLYFYGAEMLLEIARFWASIATLDGRTGRYSIRGVMGPDEYHTAYPEAQTTGHGGVDDNAYTNVMAAWCLMRAGDTLDLLPEDHCRALCERIGLSEDEREEWETISRNLHVPFLDDEVISQFSGYEGLEEFDWARYRDRYGDIRRLDRILEAEGDTPNRYKVSKQADVLMLFYLFSADELRALFEQLGYSFSKDLIPANIDYYLRRTSHGSTLSMVAHAWVLARSDRSGSWDCFQEALDSDIADTQGGTTAEGIHLGAMGGTLDLLHRCYLGIETRGDTLRFDPVMPGELRRLRVLLRYRRHKLEVEATHDTLTVASRPLTAAPITVAYRDRSRQMAPGTRFSFRLLKAGGHGDGPAGARHRLRPPPPRTRRAR